MRKQKSTILHIGSVDSANRELIGIIKQTGFEYLNASDVESAMQSVIEDSLVLIICDHELKKYSGYYAFSVLN